MVEYLRVFRHVGFFLFLPAAVVRTGELPQYVDSDRVTAEFKHGVLTIKLPKRKEAKARIEVKCC